MYDKITQFGCFIYGKKQGKSTKDSNEGNAIEGFNRQFRKVTKSKTVFPSDDSLLKRLYLATIDITNGYYGAMKSHVRKSGNPPTG